MSMLSVAISNGPVAWLSPELATAAPSGPAADGNCPWCCRFCSIGGMGGGNLRSSSARSISTLCFWNNVPLLSSFEAFASFLSDFDLSDTKEKKQFINEFIHRLFSFYIGLVRCIKLTNFVGWKIPSVALIWMIAGITAGLLKCRL